MISGGVAANKRLREKFEEKRLQATSYKLPPLKYCGDNAAMIAVAGYFHALKKDFTPFDKIRIDPNWQL